MTKAEIQRELFKRHSDFVNYLLSLSESDFVSSFQNKWSAGQQLDHICKATAPLTLGLQLPGYITRLLFGVSLNKSMSYETLVEKYSVILKNGGKASWMYRPKAIAFSERNRLSDKLLKTISKINSALEGVSEDDLDQKRLPHPLLEKLTLREMMYFTLYHVDHHKTKIDENLRQATPIPERI